MELHKSQPISKPPTYPISKLEMGFSINGCYSLPDEWRVVEDNNPGFFVYHLTFLSRELHNGKYHLKQPSLADQRAKFEDEETQKAKKGGKKGGKGDGVRDRNLNNSRNWTGRSSRKSRR